MKGFKTRTVRPGSSRPKTSQVPGITEPVHPDYGALFLESKIKDIELEKSRSKLFLHMEFKKSLEEKDIINKKYEETLTCMNETHLNRMKALTNQHQIATESLIKQFNDEINALKNMQKGQIDRLVQQNQEKIEYFEEKIEEIQKENNRKIEKILNDEAKNRGKNEERLKEEFLMEKRKMIENFEREKQEIALKTAQERDGQLKMVINKLYEENRKEWKMQEGKLNEEIRVLRFQLENQKLKIATREEIVRKSRDQFVESAIFSEEKMLSIERGEDFSVLIEKKCVNQEIQTEARVKNEGVQTEEMISKEKSEVPDLIYEKIAKVLNIKNKEILLLESKVSNLALKNKELCMLIRSLNS